MSGFTCITCRVAFSDADLQRGHYKTDWHRYNLKRKVADMPPVTAENFQQRVLAQKAQLEDEQKDNSGHCSVCNKHFNTKNAYDNHIKSKKHKEAETKQKQVDRQSNLKEIEKNAKNIALREKMQREQGEESSIPGPSSSQVQSYQGEPNSSHSIHAEGTQMEVDEDDDSDAESWESWEGDALGMEECLFCSHASSSMEKNLRHMTLHHSFFIPDTEYVSDLEGLVTYLGEKVGEGHICLWCNEKSKSFRTTKAVQQHMVDKGHCKMLHEGDTVFEYADFYDYRPSYPDYDPSADHDEEQKDEEEEEDEVDKEELDGDSFQLVLPSGAVIGHRSLQRYYRQKLRPDRQVALRNPSAINRVMAQYKALGWTGTAGPLAQKKAKDVAYIRRLQSRRHLHLGVKANRLQKHYRDQVFGC